MNRDNESLPEGEILNPKHQITSKRNEKLILLIQIPMLQTPYNSPSPGGRELEGGGFRPHLTPLPSRERKFGSQ